MTISLFVCEAVATLHKALILAEPDAEPCRVGQPCSCAPALIWMGSHCHVIPRLLWVRLRSAGDTLLQSDSHMTAALVQRQHAVACLVIRNAALTLHVWTT